MDARTHTVRKAVKRRQLEYTAPQDAVDGRCRTAAVNKSLVGGRWRVLEETRSDKLDSDGRTAKFWWIAHLLSVYYYLKLRSALGRSRRGRLKADIPVGACAAGRSAGNYLLVLGLLGTAAWTSRNALVSQAKFADTDQWHQYCS
jgi:hypothetical protein